MRRAIQIVEAVFARDGALIVHRNPNAAALRGLLARCGRLRATLVQSARESELYVWDAALAVHNDIEDEYGLEGLRMEVTPEGFIAKLRMWIEDIADYDLSRWGITDKTASPDEIAKMIEDAEAARLAAIPALRQAWGSVPPITVWVEGD